VALIEQLDDRTLVEQHRAGDEDAFRQIVVRHHRSLYANALRRLGDPVLAEDAVQEALLRAFRNLDRFEGEYHLDAWLHRIVTNACHDIGRRRGRDSRLFDRACTTVEVESPAADEGLAEALASVEVDDALGQLPESYREVLVLRFVEELSYADLAEKAGISEENARARVSRGRTMLKRLMSSTSALVVWAIPPLRRAQVEVTDPDAAAQAAQQVHHLTGVANAVSATTTSSGLGHLSALAAQAGPTIATATPSVLSAGPAMKAAVAAGLAAAVVIPTGVAVERVVADPEPKVAAPLADDEDTGSPGATVQAPVAAEPETDAPVSATSTSGPVLQAPPTSATGSTAESPTGTATPSAPAPSTSVPPADAEPEPPTSAPPAAEEPPPAAPVEVGVEADGLTVTDAGHNLAISGPVTFVVDGEAVAATVDGKLNVGDADPKDAGAPREVYLSTLRVTFDDGRTHDLSLAGTVVVTDQGNGVTYDLDLAFRFDGGSERGMPEQGTLAGELARRGDSATLAATIRERSS